MHLSGRIPIRVQGVNLTYLERPAASASSLPPLVMLHGIVSSAEGFTRLIQQLPDTRRIIALNLPGSVAQGHRRDSTWRGIVDLVHDLLQHLGVERPILLGHSHGGALATLYAATYRDELSALVLMCPAHPFLRRERILVAFYNTWIGSLVVKAFRFLPKPLHGLGFRRLLGPKGRKAVFDFRPYRSTLLEADTIREVQAMIRTWNADMYALESEITARPLEMPTLFLWGDHDPVVPVGTAARLQQCFTSWEMTTLPGVGHLPNDEDTEGCSAALRTWMQSLEGGEL